MPVQSRIHLQVVGYPKSDCVVPSHSKDWPQIASVYSFGFRLKPLKKIGLPFLKTQFELSDTIDDRTDVNTWNRKRTIKG